MIIMRYFLLIIFNSNTGCYIIINKRTNSRSRRNIIRFNLREKIVKGSIIKYYITTLRKVFLKLSIIYNSLIIYK